MVAISSEQVVGCALKYIGGFFDYRIYFVLWLDCKSVEDLALESPSWGYSSRWGVVDACKSSSVMSPVCIFSIVYDDAGMEK